MRTQSSAGQNTGLPSADLELVNYGAGRPPCGHCGEVFPQSFPINPHVPLRDRFFQKVHRCQQTDCWIWMGHLDRLGYGQMSVKGRMIRAHRVSYELHHGPIPRGLWVLHHCDNSRCVRPEHLYAGTHADNTADMVARQRCATGRRSGVYTHPESWRRRLTRAQVAQIKARPATRGRALAREFGVSEQTICDIRKGRIWADVPAAETLVLERLPNGEHAWLRRELNVATADTEQLDQDLTRRLGWPEPQPEPEERIALTDLGRRALAMERLFGSWPTLAQADAAEVSAA